jgi:protein-disulfide isomerase
MRPFLTCLALTVSLVNCGHGPARPKSKATLKQRAPSRHAETAESQPAAEANSGRLPRAFGSVSAPKKSAGKALAFGPPNAKVTIEVFTDFQCPFCARYHKTLAQIVRRFPKRVRLIHRDFPLSNACNPRVRTAFHRNACSAALTARCAAYQGKFWQVSGVFANNAGNLAPSAQNGFAQSAGVDLRKLERCRRGKAAMAAIQQDIQDGISRGVRGTPTTFFNGKMISGGRNFSWFEKQILAISP